MPSYRESHVSGKGVPKSREFNMLAANTKIFTHGSCCSAERAWVFLDYCRLSSV